MMNSKKYQNQFIVLFIWIILVILFFKFIPEKRVAAVLAGAGFVFWPALFIYNEFKKSEKSILHLIVLLTFLLTNALPIFLLRILNWNTEFTSLSLLGISVQKLHAVSNLFYLMMMASSMFLYFKNKKIEKATLE